jgi:hypothetical protein
MGPVAGPTFGMTTVLDRPLAVLAAPEARALAGVMGAAGTGFAGMGTAGMGRAGMGRPGTGIAVTAGAGVVAGLLVGDAIGVRAAGVVRVGLGVVARIAAGASTGSAVDGGWSPPAPGRCAAARAGGGASDS